MPRPVRHHTLKQNSRWQQPRLTPAAEESLPVKVLVRWSRTSMALGTALAVFLVFCLLHIQQEVSSEPTVLGYVVVADYPHDQKAFTQGLQFDRECDSESGECHDILWESTGLYGESTIRKVVLGTGEVKQKETLSNQWFAEGLTRIGDTLYQLTWLTGTIFKWKVDGSSKITPLGQVQGPLKDGWGLTTDGKQLIATDSSAVVYFINPDNMQVTRQVTVTDGGRSVKWLNELEVIEGELWANIWQTECIARINMETGAVTHWILLHGLRRGLVLRHPKIHDMDVLNGIAYDAAAKRLFVTGKKWPKIFEVVPRHKARNDLTLDQVREHCIR